MELRLAAARLVATPLFTIFAVLSLAAGVAVTTAVYSVVDTLFLRELGIRDPEHVAVIVASYAEGSSRIPLSEPDFRDLRAAQTSFSSLSATASIYPAVSSPSTTEVLPVEAVDGAYFSTFGVDAALGRVLLPSDDDGAAHVAVISHALWRLRFASDAAVVGQTVRIGGQPFEVVGVASASFQGVTGGIDGTRVWIPLSTEARLSTPSPSRAAPSDPRERRRLQVFGRLVQTATVAAASAELASIAAMLDASFPGRSAATLSDRAWSARTMAAISDENDGTQRFGLTLMALVSLVLVVACTNLANLMLARGTSRQRELAIRSALGASRWRLVREQCIESLLLALGGAAASYVVFQALQVWMSVDFNLMGRWTLSIRPALDLQALAVAGVALLLALGVFGLEPALHLARAVNIAGAIAAAKGRSRTRRQRMVIRWQVAISTGFFIVATMFVRQTLALARHDSGIAIDRIAVAVLNIDGPLWDEPRLRRTLDRVMEEGRKDPSIEAVSVSTGLPFGVPGLQLSLSRPGDPAAAAANPRVSGVAATPSIFTTLGVRIVRGRAFDERDDAAAARVAVLSEFTARRLFGAADAIGQQVTVQRRSRPPQTATVVGIAHDTDVRSILADPAPLVYLALAQQYEASLTIVARSSGEARRAVPALREALRRSDPDLSVEVLGTGYEILSGPFEILRAGGMSTLYLGGLTLLLAMVGLFGVQSHLIAQRTREIGVRMSMGATARQIKAMVLLDGYRPVLEGLTLGLWGGFAGRMIVRSYVQIDVAVVDPWMLIVTPIPVIAAAFCACYLPAHRAAAVDPTEALRCE